MGGGGSVAWGGGGGGGGCGGRGKYFRFQERNNSNGRFSIKIIEITTYFDYFLLFFSNCLPILQNVA